MLDTPPAAAEMYGNGRGLRRAPSQAIPQRRAPAVHRAYQIRVW